MASEEHKKGLEHIVSLSKRRGFIYQGSEIYGGLAGTWDYGPLGVILKKNIENLWWKQFVSSREDMYGIESAILMNPRVWEASGHIESFHDPLVEDQKTKKRYRADHLLKGAGVDPAGMTLQEMAFALESNKILSPDGNPLSSPQQFNMMFKTAAGSVEGEDTTVYLRPETAQGMFVNFKNILDTFHPKLPFGIAQIGKSFRNEINARDFLFRVRELEIMEFEYFVREEEWAKYFEYWREEYLKWFSSLGIDSEKIMEEELGEKDRAHYSKRTLDFYYEFPFGADEVGGIAYRTDYDLQKHAEVSGAVLTYHDEKTGEKFIPHVIEPTFGLGRHILMVLAEAYREDALGGEARTYLALKPALAPYKAAVFPLLRNKPELVSKAREVYEMVKKEIPQTMWDDNGNIGKRYRRQDEIGTPFCITVDFDTLEDDTVTLRDRDSGVQTRVPAAKLVEEITRHL